MITNEHRIVKEKIRDVARAIIKAREFSPTAFKEDSEWINQIWPSRTVTISHA